MGRSRWSWQLWRVLRIIRMLQYHMIPHKKGLWCCFMTTTPTLSPRKQDKKEEDFDVDKDLIRCMSNTQGPLFLPFPTHSFLFPKCLQRQKRARLPITPTKPAPLPTLPLVVMATAVLRQPQCKVAPSQLPVYARARGESSVADLVRTH